MNIKEELIRRVNESNGIKAVELVSQMASEFPHDFQPEIIWECVKEGLIVELEYTVPSADYRIKSILFPVGTKIHNLPLEDTVINAR